MNDKLRSLLRYVNEGDIRKCRQQAKIIVNDLKGQNEQRYKENMLRELDSKLNFYELPQTVSGLLIAEDVSSFPENRFLLRDSERATVSRTLATLKAAVKLSELGISYQPSVMLYGESGTGKTMLARYIAHKAGLPFVYVRFSNLVSSYLGNTQGNVAKVFDYARSAQCVLCFDEIDAVGMARGQTGDVGEMNRVVIALMQEMDRLPNGIIVVGTTNRFDRLDSALARRFTIKQELFPLSTDDALHLSKKFLTSAGIDADTARLWSCALIAKPGMTAAEVADECTAALVKELSKEEATNE